VHGSDQAPDKGRASASNDRWSEMTPLVTTRVPAHTAPFVVSRRVKIWSASARVVRSCMISDDSSGEGGLVGGH
jgi:hypothetical protein